MYFISKKIVMDHPVNSISRKILATLMLLFFVGHVTVSSAIACEMDLEASPQVTEEHHGHHPVNSDNDSSHHDDCCDNSGNCTMSGCIAMAIMNQDYDIRVVHLDETPVTLDPLHIDLLSSSLYRPPILV